MLGEGGGEGGGESLTGAKQLNDSGVDVDVYSMMHCCSHSWLYISVSGSRIGRGGEGRQPPGGEPQQNVISEVVLGQYLT
jgi:hypothetical protein